MNSMNHTFVKDVMKTDLVTIDVSETVKAAAMKMTDKNVGCAIVMEKENPIGIITEKDFVNRISAKDIPNSSPLSEVMSSPLITINAEDTVWEAAELMKIHNIHKLPVKQKNNIVGIITATDLVEICSVGSDSEMRRICDQILTRMEKNFSSE